MPLPALTAKDRADLTFALEHNVDWIALSFVQRPEDVAEARALIGGKAALLAKIEKPAALERLAELLELAEAVMVARGDLGVEWPPRPGPPAPRPCGLQPGRGLPRRELSRPQPARDDPGRGRRRLGDGAGA